MGTGVGEEKKKRKEKQERKKNYKLEPLVKKGAKCSP